MKKFILVEVETNKQTPFRHFSDLINLKHSNSIGVDSIVPMPQVLNPMKHRKFRNNLYLNSDGKDLTIESFSDSSILKLDLDFITDILHEPKVTETWIGCGYVYNHKTSEFDKDIRFWYRSTEDRLIHDCFTDELIAGSSPSIIVDTIFIFHGSVTGAPVYHMLLNDDVIFNATCKINNEKYFVDDVNFHDGTFKEFLLKPGVSKCFVHDNIIITPRDTFEVDFYSRTALYDKGFPFETLDLKVKSNIDFEKISTGKYKFSLKGKDYGYIYARINSRFGVEQEKSTTLRVAYTVHKS